MLVAIFSIILWIVNTRWFVAVLEPFNWNVQTSFEMFKRHLECSNFIWNVQTSFGMFKLHLKCSNFIWLIWNVQTSFGMFKLHLVTCGLFAVMWYFWLQQLLNAENIACPEVAPCNGAIHPELKQQLGCESNYPHLSRHADTSSRTLLTYTGTFDG